MFHTLGFSVLTKLLRLKELQEMLLQFIKVFFSVTAVFTFSDS